MHKIIAIVGMCGSGKSVACEYLEELGFKRVYFGGLTMKILKDLNLEVTPENEKKVREDLRKKHGMAAYAIELLPEIKDLSKNYDVVLDGLYSWDELVVLKENFKDLITIAIITDKKIRYERLNIRDVRPLTCEEAKNRDLSEIENIKKGGPIAYADYYVLNNFDRNNLKERMKEIIKELS